MPPGVRLVLGVMVASLITGSKAAYSFLFYNCHNICNILTYKVSNTCNCKNPWTNKDTTTTTFTIRQKQDVVAMNGYVSHIKYAGAYSTQRS